MNKQKLFRKNTIIDNAVSILMKSYLSPISDTLSNILKDRALYMVSTLNGSIVADTTISAITEYVLTRYFKNIPSTVYCDMQYINGGDNGKNNINIKPDCYKKTYVNLVKYKNTPILISIELTSPLFTNNDNSEVCKSVNIIKFYTINVETCRKNLDEFILASVKKARVQYLKQMEELYHNNQIKFAYLNSNNNYVNRWNFINKELLIRPDDSVFLPAKQKNELYDTLDKFMNSKAWYIKNNIPYHFGILLHGEPGTGKSSLIRSLIGRINIDRLYIASGENLNKLSNIIQSIGQDGYRNNNRFNVFIVEDIDCCETTKSRVNIPSNNIMINTYTDKNFGVSSLSELLNSLDGFLTSNNVIFIFTTNHIDDLDPALIRPGRIDLSVNVRHPNAETMNDFLMHHYNQGLPKKYSIKKNLTFADLQTKLMSGYTYDDMLKYIKSEPRKKSTTVDEKTE